MLPVLLDRDSEMSSLPHRLGGASVVWACAACAACMGGWLFLGAPSKTVTTSAQSAGAAAIHLPIALNVAGTNQPEGSIPLGRCDDVEFSGPAEVLLQISTRRASIWVSGIGRLSDWTPTTTLLSDGRAIVKRDHELFCSRIDEEAIDRFRELVYEANDALLDRYTFADDADVTEIYFWGESGGRVIEIDGFESVIAAPSTEPNDIKLLIALLFLLRGSEDDLDEAIYAEYHSDAAVAFAIEHGSREDAALWPEVLGGVPLSTLTRYRYGKAEIILDAVRAAARALGDDHVKDYGLSAYFRAAGSDTVYWLAATPALPRALQKTTWTFP